MVKDLKDIEIIPYRAAHALAIKVRQQDLPDKEYEHFEIWAKFNENGAAFTGMYKGQVAGCAGIRILWEGVGEGWAIFSDQVEHLAAEAYGYVKKYLHTIMDDHGLWRVQVNVRTDLEVYSRYVEGLGFKREGLMRKYYLDGSDRYLYAIIKE